MQADAQLKPVPSQDDFRERCLLHKQKAHNQISKHTIFGDYSQLRNVTVLSTSRYIKQQQAITLTETEERET
jgi:hypothetical protein